MGTKSTIKPETKTVGIGSQILKELGLTEIKLLATPVKYPSLSGFDLEVIGFEQWVKRVFHFQKIKWVDKKITMVASKWTELVQELVKSGIAHLEMLGITNQNCLCSRSMGVSACNSERISSCRWCYCLWSSNQRRDNCWADIWIVAQGLMQIGIDHFVIAFRLIATENLQQAKDRVSPSKLNKGREIAQSLVEMLG